MNFRINDVTRVVFFCFVGVVSADAIICANDQIPGKPQKRPVMITGGIVHRVDTKDIVGGDVLFENGVITAIGKNITPPENADVIDATNKHVYPGLFGSFTDLGLREISSVGETEDRTESGLDNPNVRTWIAVNPDSELIPVARAGGVLTVHVAPGGRWIRGQSAVMNLDGWTAKEMIVSAPSAMCVDWESYMPRRGDPMELIGQREGKLKAMDTRIDQARRYAAAKAAAEDNGRSDLFPVDVRLEAWLMMLDGRVPMVAIADHQSAIESVVAFAAEHSLRLIIYGGFDAESCADLLIEQDVPVLIASTYRLPHRRHDAYDSAYSLPARLKRAGVRFAITGEGAGYPGGASQTRNLAYHAACAVAFGLDRQAAVRAITLSPAEILGVSDQVGSITVGKDATLIIATGDILETQSNLTHAFIAGRRVDLSSRHTLLYEKYQQKYRE